MHLFFCIRLRILFDNGLFYFFLFEGMHLLLKIKFLGLSWSLEKNDRQNFKILWFFHRFWLILGSSQKFKIDNIWILEECLKMNRITMVVKFPHESPTELHKQIHYKLKEGSQCQTKRKTEKFSDTELLELIKSR